MIIVTNIKILNHSNGTYSLTKNDEDLVHYYKKIGNRWHLFSEKGVSFGESVDFHPINFPENYALLENTVRKLKLEKLLK